MSLKGFWLDEEMIIPDKISVTPMYADTERHRRETSKALAHDLKTPLSIISGYAQNLMENIRTEKREKYAAGIQANVERVVDNFL